MKASPRAYDHVRFEEGLRLKAYQDWAGVWTIGYGHTGTAKQGMTITKAQADALLAQDMATVEARLNACIHRPITQEQYDALVGFAFNVGIGGACSSTLVKKLNAGDVQGAALEFARWNKITDPKTGKKIPDPKGILQARRAREMALFLGGKVQEAAVAAVETVKKNPAIWLLALGAAGLWLASQGHGVTARRA